MGHRWELFSLAAQGVVILTISNAPSDDNFLNMAAFNLQCGSVNDVDRNELGQYTTKECLISELQLVALKVKENKRMEQILWEVLRW